MLHYTGVYAKIIRNTALLFKRDTHTMYQEFERQISIYTLISCLEEPSPSALLYCLNALVLTCVLISGNHEDLQAFTRSLAESKTHIYMNHNVCCMEL